MQPTKSNKEYLDEFKRASVELYVARTKGDQATVDILTEKLGNLTEAYVAVGGKISTLKKAAAFSTRALKDSTLEEMAHLITKNPLIDGVNKEALRVSGLGNRFGVQIILDTGTQRLAIGAGNNSMHAFMSDAGFNQIVDIEDAKRLNELRQRTGQIEQDIDEIVIAIRGRGRLAPGANKYVATTFDPDALRAAYLDKRAQWGQAMDELGVMSSKYYTSVVLPGNDTAYSRVLEKIHKQNPSINVYMDRDMVPYAQKINGDDLPLNKALELVSNVEFFSDTPIKDGDFLLKRVQVDGKISAILAKHEPSGKVVAYIPPVRAPKPGEASALKKVLQDPDFPIDLLYVDMRYSDINNMIVVDREFTSKSYKYLTDREISRTIVQTYAQVDKRPQKYMLMNIDNNMQAGTIASSIESSLLTWTDDEGTKVGISRPEVFLSNIGHDKRPVVFVMDHGDEIAVRASKQTSAEIIEDAIQLSQERSRDARVFKADATIDDIKWNEDDENIIRGLTTADEDIRTEADRHAQRILTDLSDMPKAITGEAVVKEIAAGIPEDAFGIMTDQTETNTSAVGWLDLHIDKKSPNEIKGEFKKFSTIDGKEIQLLGIKKKPEYQKLLRDAVLSQDDFDKNIVWSKARDAKGVIIKSNIDARAEFIKIVREYAWVEPNFELNFGPSVDWIRHEEDVVKQITTSSMFYDEADANKIVQVYQGTIAKYFEGMDIELVRVLGDRHEADQLLKDRSRIIEKIGKQISKEASKNYVVLDGLALDYGMPIDELYKAANNFDEFSKLPMFDKGRELEISKELISGKLQEEVRIAQRKIFYHYNHKKAYEDFWVWLGENQDQLKARVDEYGKTATKTQVEEIAFTIDRASSFRLRGLGIELETRFNQLQKIVDAKKSFDAPVEYQINITRIQELFKSIKVATPEKRAFLVKELDNAISRFGGVNNLFVDPPIYFGFDTIIGGHVARILAEIDTLNAPFIELQTGPLANIIDYAKFQDDVFRIEDGMRKYIDVIRGNNELSTLVNDYFKFKVNDFAKELGHLSSLNKHAEYNIKLGQATEFVLGTLGYAPTELRKFVLLDAKDIGSFRRDNFDSSAGIIFAHAEKLIKEATDKTLEKANHHKIIENKLKVASNKELHRLLIEREALNIQLADRMKELDGLERNYSNVYHNLPKIKRDGIEISTSSKDENATAYAFRAMEQLRDNRIKLKDEVQDIRAKIVALDKEKITKFDVIGEGLYADNVVAGFNALRTGEINPEASRELSHVLAVMDARRLEKAKLMVLLRDVQALHEKRLAMTKPENIAAINKEIFALVKKDASFLDSHAYAEIVLPKINIEMNTNYDADRHIGFISESIEFRIGELDTLTNRAEKALQRLKSYSTRIDIPFKRFVRESVRDDRGIINNPHLLMSMNGNNIGMVKRFPPNLYSGAPVSERPGLPLDLMKKFGLSGDRALLFPARVEEQLVYKLHVPLNANAAQADELIAEAERVAKKYNVDTVVVEFPARIFNGFVPDPNGEYKMLSKYYTTQDKEYFGKGIMPGQPRLIGSGYHYDISPDNKINKFQTIISRAQIKEMIGYSPYTDTPKPPERMDLNELMDIYDRVRIIIDDMGTAEQKAAVASELEQWRVERVEDITNVAAGGVKAEKKGMIDKVVKRGFRRYRGLETAEFPVVVFVDKNMDIRIKNLGTNYPDGTLDQYSQVLLNSGKGYLPNDAEFSIILSGTGDRFRVTGAEGTLPNQVSFNSVVHVVTDLVSTKTRTKYLVDVVGMERDIITAFHDMDKDIKRLGLNYEDVKYVKDAETRLKNTLADELVAYPGVRSVEKTAMKKYEEGMTELYNELLKDETKFGKWHRYVSIKNKYLGEVGKNVYGGERLGKDEVGVITGLRNNIGAGVSIWFDNDMPVQQIPSSYIDLQIKETYAAIAAEPQKSNELYVKLEALRAIKHNFVNPDNRTLAFNPAMNAVYNEYTLSKLIEVDLNAARITNDAIFQTGVEQQIRLLRASIAREEELASKILLHGENIEKLLAITGDDGKFLNGERLRDLRGKQVKTAEEIEELRKLELHFVHFQSLTTNQSRLVADIDKMISAPAEASTIQDWFKLRYGVVEVVAKDWLSNTNTSLARILPKTPDFLNSINGSPVEYINLFVNRDVKIRELSDATRKLVEDRGKYNQLMEESGISGHRAEYSRIQKEIEELTKRRTAILDKFAKMHTVDNADDVIERLNGGVPFVDPKVATQMKYILRRRFEELGGLRELEKENPIRTNSINRDIIDVDRALKDFDKMNEANMQRRAETFGTKLIDDAIEANRSRLIGLSNALENPRVLQEAEDLDSRVVQFSDIVSTLSAELDSIEMKIKQMPSEIAEDAQFVYLMTKQRTDQIGRIEKSLTGLKNDYGKSGGEIAAKLKGEIDELEANVLSIKELLADEGTIADVKKAEGRLAKNLLQYDDVKLANLQYIKDQIVEQTKDLYDIYGNIKPEVEARLKLLNDTLKKKDLYKGLEDTLNDLGRVQHERMWVLENAGKVDMFPKYTRRLADLDEKLGVLRSKRGELIGQLSTVDPFYDIHMLKHDYGVVKKIFKNLIKSVTPPPKDVVTTAQNNLAEIYVKRYITTQFERKFGAAAEEVDILLDSATTGKKVDKNTVARIVDALKTKTPNDFVFLDENVEKQFVKAVIKKGKAIVSDISGAAEIRGKILAAETKLNTLNGELDALNRMGVIGHVLSEKDMKDIRLFNLTIKTGLDPNAEKVFAKDVTKIKYRIEDLKKNINIVNNGGELVEIDFMGKKTMEKTTGLIADREALKKIGKIERLTKDQIGVMQSEYVLKDLVAFIETQKIKTPSTDPNELGKLFDYSYERVNGPLKALLDDWTAIYAKEFDVVSVDRFKVLTILSRNIDKDKLNVNISKLEKKAHTLRIKVNTFEAERDAAQKTITTELAQSTWDNLNISNLSRKIRSLDRKYTASNAELAEIEEFITVGKQFAVRGVNIADVAAKTKFKESVLDFLQVSFGKKMATDEAGRLAEVDQTFKILNMARANRISFTFNELKDRTIMTEKSEFGRLIEGVVDGVLRSSDNYNAKASRMLASELERHLRSLGVNVNSTFKIAGWNLPKARKTLNKALIVDITSPVFVASVRESFKKVGINADEFIYDMAQSLQTMSGVSRDHYGRRIVNALHTNIESSVMEFLSALSRGSVEMPFVNLQGGLSQQEAEEYRNLLAKSVDDLSDAEILRVDNLRRWSRGLRVAPKFEEGKALKTYIRPYLMDDGTIVIAGNQIVYDPDFDILEPRFRIWKTFNEPPLTRVERYLFKNYDADRKMLSALFITPEYDSRGLVASALELILKEKFGITIEGEIAKQELKLYDKKGNIIPEVADEIKKLKDVLRDRKSPDAIFLYPKFHDKLHGINLNKLIDSRHSDPEYIAKYGKINPPEWVKLMSETETGVQDTFLNMLRAADVDVYTLIRSNEWAKEYQPKISAYGKVHEQVLRLKRRIIDYETDIYVRVNDIKAPRGVQIGLNPKLIANFLLRGKFGQDMQDTANRYKKAMFPEGYDTNVFNVVARDIKDTWTKYVHREDVEQIIDINNNRKAAIKALLDRDRKSIGVIDGREYTIDDVERVADDLLKRVKNVAARLEGAGAEGVAFNIDGWQHGVRKNPKGVVRDISNAFDLLVMNSFKDSIEPSYKKIQDSKDKGSLLDNLLKEARSLETELLNVPFVKATQTESLVWSGSIKLASGNTVSFVGADASIDVELVSLRKLYSEATDGAEKLLINSDIRNLETIGDTLEKLEKINRQNTELAIVLREDMPIINKYVRIFDALSTTKNGIATASKEEIKSVDRIKWVRNRITFLAGDRPDGFGGEIAKLKSGLSVDSSGKVVSVDKDVIKKKLDKLEDELKGLRVELNGGVVSKKGVPYEVVYKDKTEIINGKKVKVRVGVETRIVDKVTPGLIHKIPEKMRIAEYIDGEIVLHTVNDLMDEMRNIDTAIGGFTLQLPKMDELRIFQRLVRPVQDIELAVGDELIDNIDTVIHEMASAIVEKNELIHMPMYKQDFVSGIVYASTDDLIKEIKKVEDAIKEAEKIGDKNGANELIVRFNDLVSRRVVASRGAGKMFTDKQALLSDQEVMRDIDNIRAQIRASYKPDEIEVLKGKLIELEKKVREPIEIRQIDETKQINKIKELREKIDNAGIAAKEEDVAEVLKLQRELNEISGAGVHIKMNTEQIAVFDRLGVLWDRSRTINNHEWMALYKNEYNELMARLDKVGDPFMGAKYINSTFHNLGVMMQRDMNIGQVLTKWHKDVRGMLSLDLEDVGKAINDLMGELKPAERIRINDQLDALRERLDGTPDDDKHMLLRSHYEKRIGILEDRVGVTSQRGFRKYQAVFDELYTRLGGGVGGDGEKIEGLVPSRQAIRDHIKQTKEDLALNERNIEEIERLKREITSVGYPKDRAIYNERVTALQDRIDELNRKLLGADGIARHNKRIAALTIEENMFNNQIKVIEEVINMVLNNTTSEYQTNLYRFKEIAMSLPLEPDELKYIEIIDKELPNDVVSFVNSVSERLSAEKVLVPKFNELHAIIDINHGSARDVMQAMVEHMGNLSTHSIPTGEDMSPDKIYRLYPSDLTARFRVGVDYFEKGELKFPTEQVTDFITATAHLADTTKKYNAEIAKLDPGTVIMSEAQIQALRTHLDSIEIPGVNKDEREIWVNVLEKLKGKGYDPSHMLPSDRTAEKKRLLRSLQADREIPKGLSQRFLTIDGKIAKYEAKDHLEERISDAAKELNTQIKLARIRSTMAKYRAEVMLIENMVHYKDVARLKQELIKLSNTKELLFGYKDAVAATILSSKEIALPGKTQTIKMSNDLVEKLADTFTNERYLSRVSNGEVVRTIKGSIKDIVPHTDLTNERMDILRKIVSDISKKHMEATGEMLSFTDDHIREAYRLMDGVAPIYKRFDVVDASGDASEKYVPAIDGTIQQKLSLRDVSKVEWRDPFVGRVSEARPEVQLLEEYLKTAFIHADNKAIADTFQEIVKATMPKKINQILNIIRTRVPHEKTLKVLDKALRVGISKGVVVGKVIEEANKRVNLSLGAVNSFVRELLDGVGRDSEKLLLAHSGLAQKYYQKGAKFARYVGGRKDVGSLLQKVVMNASIKGKEELINTAALILNEEARRTTIGVKNILNTLLKGTYIMNARETTNTLGQIASVAKPVAMWDMHGPEITTALDTMGVMTENWSSSVFGKRSNSIIGKLLGRVNKAGNDMDRKMAQGVMPQYAVGSAVKDVRSAYSQAANDLEGLVSDTGYTAFNRTAMANYIDNADQIRYFEYTAINDSRTCKYCRSTHGILYKPAEPRPELPRHPNCRCTYRPWFKSISSATDEMENAQIVPRVPIGESFTIQPDDFAGFGDGLSKLMKPVNADGTISDEDWIMWFNKQPANIRQMMVGDAHDLANSVGVFGVDSPANKKALIAEASKNVAKQFMKDMGNNSVRAMLWNTFTNKNIYSSLFKIKNSPKEAAKIISKIPWRALMFDPSSGIVKNSVTDAFNKSVSGFVPIDPNEAGPLQAVLSRIAGNKTFSVINAMRNLGGDFVLAKMAGMTKEQWDKYKGVLGGKITDAEVRNTYMKAAGLGNKDSEKNNGFLQSEFMRAIDPWFNIGAEGISPLADMSIVERTKIFTDLANDIKALPESEAVSARLRAISRGNRRLNNIYNMGNVADDGVYRIQDMLNSGIVDSSVDAVKHKEVLDIYGKLMGKTRSGATELLDSPEFKSRLLELSDSKRQLLIDMVKKPTVRATLKRFFVDIEANMVTELDRIRVVEISPNGIRLFGSLPTKVDKLTIGPDGRWYAASKEELILIWKKTHPRVDQSKFVSMEIDIGGSRQVNPAYTKWMEEVGTNMERIPNANIDRVVTRGKALKTRPQQFIGHEEYIIRTNEGDKISKNKEIVEEALGKIRGISPWSTRNQITDLATTGITRIGQGAKSAYSKKYDEAINRVEHTIRQVVSNMKNEVGMQGQVSGDKVEQIATTVRGQISDILYAYEYRDVRPQIMQFVGEYKNGELFLSRIRLIIDQS